jgi:D-sedoheptulose 7-phosphate isomerase
VNSVDKFFDSDPSKFADSYLKYLSNILDGISREEIAGFIGNLLDARKSSASVFFIGNGGSASTASHFANDLALGTNSYDKPFRVFSLVDNPAVMTAIGNDFGYEEVFERQLRVLAKPGDYLVSISASGNSKNLIRAIDYANMNKIHTIGITSFDGGQMKQICKSGIHVPANPKEYGPAEDAHLVLDHLTTAYLARFINGI